VVYPGGNAFAPVPVSHSRIMKARKAAEGEEEEDDEDDEEEEEDEEEATGEVLDVTENWTEAPQNMACCVVWKRKGGRKRADRRESVENDWRSGVTGVEHAGSIDSVPCGHRNHTLGSTANVSGHLTCCSARTDWRMPS
jgi:hypothetical protein